MENPTYDRVKKFFMEDNPPMGTLLAIMSGEEPNFDDAIQFCLANKQEVEELCLIIDRLHPEFQKFDEQDWQTWLGNQLGLSRDLIAGNLDFCKQRHDTRGKLGVETGFCQSAALIKAAKIAEITTVLVAAKMGENFWLRRYGMDVDSWIRIVEKRQAEKHPDQINF